jgi:signal transduction histidine kinase
MRLDSLRKKLLLYFLLPGLMLMMLFSVITWFLFRSLVMAQVSLNAGIDVGGAEQSGLAVPMYFVLIFLLISNVLFAFLLFGTVIYLERRYASSMMALKDAVIRLGEGNYDIELPVEHQDEIGSLTMSFNLMVRQIREKTHDLELERYGRTRSVIDGEERERQRLSRELHDGIGQLLIAIKLRLESLLYQDGKEVKNSIQELKKYFDQIIDEVRRISNNLMPSVLEAFGLVIAFRNLFLDTEEHSNVKIHFESSGNFEMMDKKVMTYVYRLTQEAINNIVKHAEAKDVWVKLSRKTDMLTLTIEDNGVGFHPETAGKGGGSGLHNMHERASLLQGNINIRSVPGKGTTIHLVVPTIAAYVNNTDFPRG